MNVQEHMEKLGFYLTATGGGCTAYEHVNPDDASYLLVTARGEPTAPETLTEPITLGFYNTFGQPVCNIGLPNIEAITCVY